MRRVIWGLLAAVAVYTVGTGTAWACPVEGTVICERTNTTDPAVPVPNVGLTFTDGTFTYPMPYSGGPYPTDASGWFSFRIAGGDGACPGLWSVTLDLSAVGGATSVPLAGSIFIDYDPEAFVLAPIEVGADLVPACGGSQTACDLTAVPEGVLPCDARPWGNPRAECSHFGNFVPTGDGFASDGGTLTATTVADFAITKAGRACYAITKNVSLGDPLGVPLEGGVSHVTYCSCPPGS